MKNTFYLLILMISVINYAAQAQCNQYYQFEEGSEWEMQNYNGKDKLTGTTQQKVTAFNKTADGFDATIHSFFANDKGKKSMEGDLDFKCSGGTMFIDMRNFVSEDQMKAFENWEFKIESENLEIPSTLTAGQTLKDASFLLTTVNSPLPLKLNVKITDRKVAGNESITTPAGTFDCVKVTSNTSVHSIGNLNFSTVEWIAPKVGLVRSESYNKNGKLVGYSVLSKRK